MNTTTQPKDVFNKLLTWTETQIQPSSTTILFIAAVIIGIGTSIGAIIFINLINRITRFFYGTLPGLLPGLGRGWILLIPAIGGLVAGPIIAYFAREAKGHGVPEVMQAIALRGGRIRPRVAVAKVIASSFCIGTGGSAGREGPIVQVGAALGSSFAQLLRFSESRIRNLVACGAAAGIAATFNAPFAGVVFSIEIILGEIALEHMGSVVIAAITASTLTQAVLGDETIFSIPFYGIKNLPEIGLYVGLGLVAAVVGVLFIKSLYWFEDKFDAWKFPEAFKPVVGGLLLGLTGWLYPLLLGTAGMPASQTRLGLPLIDNIPHIFGSGFSAIEGALLGELSFGLMFLLIFMKVLGTSFTLGSGNSGGVFAPSLLIGAMTGGAFGKAADALFPGLIAGSGAYATVGMAAVFAAAARAPLTAILIVFEMTDDYRILLPLMAAVIIATLFAQHLHKESIYTLKLVRKGINLFRGRDMDVMAAVQVHEVMDTNPTFVTPDMPIQTLLDLFFKTNSHGFAVINEQGELFGIVSLEDVRKRTASGKVDEELQVKDIATRSLVVAFPDETLSQVLQRMAPRDLSRIPVVDRQNPKKLVGVVRRNNIVRAYEVGTVRRGFALGSLPGSPRGTATGQYFVAAGSPLVNKTLAEIKLPESLLIIHLQRGSKIILPHGDTTLEAGDIVTILTRDGDINQMDSTWQQLHQEQPQ